MHETYLYISIAPVYYLTYLAKCSAVTAVCHWTLASSFKRKLKTLGECYPPSPWHFRDVGATFLLIYSALFTISGRKEQEI